MKKAFLPFIIPCLSLFSCQVESNDNQPDNPDTVIHVSAVSLSQHSLTLEEGATAVLAATITPSNASDKRISWSSDNSAVAAVDDGRVDAKRAGSADITVKTEDGGFTDICHVTVTPSAAPSVTYDAKVSAISAVLSGKANFSSSTMSSDLTMGIMLSEIPGMLPTNSRKIKAEEIGADYSYSIYFDGLTPEKVYYYRSYITQQGIDTYGEIKTFTTPVAIETLEAESIGSTTATLRGRVNLIEEDFSHHTVSYYINCNKDYKAWNRKEDGTFSVQVSSLSSNSDYSFYAYLTVERKGDNPGTVTYKGETLHFSTPPVAVTGVELNHTEATLRLYEGMTLRATVIPSDASNKKVRWTVTAPDVISISSKDNSATIGSLGLGEGRVTVTTEDGGFTAECSVSFACPPPVTPEAVDLGLSSKWASFNLGATSPEDFGYYYAWAETETKRLFNWTTYKWCNGTDKSLTKYNNLEQNGTVDNNLILDIEDDSAFANLGGDWRIPTKEDWEELTSKCTWKATTENGVYGYKVTSKNNSNGIFLPAGSCLSYNSTTISIAAKEGYFWATDLRPGYPDQASAYVLTTVGHSVTTFPRAHGFSVRPVLVTPVAGISINPGNVTMSVGDDVTIQAKISPYNASHKGVTWALDNPDVVELSISGNYATVHARKEGTATITVTSNDLGQQAVCTVTVSGYQDPVDLGLSVKWAAFNLGASRPKEEGDLFAWAETSSKSSYSLENYTWYSTAEERYTKYARNDGNNRWDLYPEDDAAIVQWGGNWRMPTADECAELLNRCTWSNATLDGVSGHYVKASNGNRIFLPSGTYWSSTAYSSNSAFEMGTKGSKPGRWYAYFYSGFLIRPVSP